MRVVEEKEEEAEDARRRIVRTGDQGLADWKQEVLMALDGTIFSLSLPAQSPLLTFSSSPLSLCWLVNLIFDWLLAERARMGG